MAQKVFNLPESTSRTQTHKIIVPGLKEIENISVNTGTVTIEKVEGEEVTIKLASGTYSRRVQTGGSYTPADSKTVSTTPFTRTYKSPGDLFGGEPSRSQSYNQGGYTGTLSREDTTIEGGGSGDGSYPMTIRYWYSGRVTRPASDTRTYQNYYQYNVTVNYIDNAPPTISRQDTNLGDKNEGFSITYSIDDSDTEDILTVKEKINGQTIRTRTNAARNRDYTIEITEEMLFSYELYITNTIEIEVDDGAGHIVTRRYTFKRTNTAPKISGADADLGEKTEGFDITFSATDQENDSMSAKIYINDKLVKIYESITSGQEYIYSLSKLDFVQLNNTDVHKIRIEVQDHNNATALRNYTFTRSLTRVMYAFEKETDIMATQILISPTWSIAEGAEAKVLVCNNAYDEVPTWEDATEQILLERHFNFTNTEKTGATWGIGVQIIINKGTATELSHLAGFGGAFK